MRISDWSSDVCSSDLTWQMLCAFRRAASTLARLPLISSDHIVPLHSEVCASFSNDASYAVLSGDHERGFNACVELCDRHVEGGPALRFLSATGEVEEDRKSTRLNSSN